MSKINLKLTLQAPLSHFGDERMGTMQVARKIKLMVDSEAVDIPIFTGNAFRGILRRLSSAHYLKYLGIADEGVNKTLYHAFFTGGALTSGSYYNEIEEKRVLRRMCPVLSVFGSALGDSILQGKLKQGIFYPVCEQTQEYTGIESDISVYSLLSDIFYTRRDDLKSDPNPDIEINKEEKQDKKKEVATQMKYEMQCLATGTELVASMHIDANEIDLAFLAHTLKLFEESPFIGGKSSIGHGKVKIEYKEFADPQIYLNYLDSNKQDIIAWLRELEIKLK